MHVLIRDASRRFHPIVGIGALASSAVQISVRDRVVGWTPLALASNDVIESLLRRRALGHVVGLILDGNPWRIGEWVDGDRSFPESTPPQEPDSSRPTPEIILGEGDEDPDAEAVLAARVRLLEAEFGLSPAEVVAHLGRVIKKRVDALYTADLLTDPLLSNSRFAQPGEATLKRLAEIRDELDRANQVFETSASEDLEQEARSPRYLRKRIVELHKLLRARRTIQDSSRGGKRTPEEAARWLLSRSSRRLALKAALREVKKNHVAASIMDVTTCGALAPYNQILGGKLVALLLASPQVVQAYFRRYDGADSIIASRMQARAVQRPANLVLLCTTSLYGGGSSQYSRLGALVGRDPDGTPREVSYHLAGKTLGYGTVHVAPDTYAAMRALLAAHGRSESDQFGAGVNAKMRRVSAALALVGLGGLEAHQQSRLVYLAPLARNWRRVLLGLDDAPDYPLDPKTGTADVVDVWRQRYFVPRVLRTHDGHGDPFDLVSKIRNEDAVTVPVNTQSRSHGPLFEDKPRLPYHSR